jgi:hypothetical protein
MRVADEGFLPELAYWRLGSESKTLWVTLRVPQFSNALKPLRPRLFQIQQHDTEFVRYARERDESNTGSDRQVVALQVEEPHSTRQCEG